MRADLRVALVEATVPLRHTLKRRAVDRLGALAHWREANREDGVLNGLGGRTAVGKDAEAAEGLPEESQLFAAGERGSNQLAVLHNRIRAKVLHVRRLLLSSGHRA